MDFLTDGEKAERSRRLDEIGIADFGMEEAERARINAASEAVIDEYRDLSERRIREIEAEIQGMDEYKNRVEEEERKEARRKEIEGRLEEIFGQQETDPGVSSPGNDGIRFRIATTAEERAIEEKAKANGTWMKAPNGKPTSLTPKQWVQVRTAGFKKKYGDWGLANLLNRARIAWNDKNSKDKVVISLSDRAKTRFDELLGTDIKQFIITDDAIRHIKNKHGQNEESRGQRNLTPEDIAVIPYLVNNFDTMELKPSENDRQGNRAIEIRKRINGVSVVGTIEKGKNKEFLVTNFQFIKSDALDASKETPGLNVRNDSDMAKVRKDIEGIQQSARKYKSAFDENGEPAAETVDEYIASQDEAENAIRFRKGSGRGESGAEGLRKLGEALGVRVEFYPSSEGAPLFVNLSMVPALCSYHKATFPPFPKSREAEPNPKALKTLLMVGSVIMHLPLSSLDICDFFTPTFSPNSSCVRFCLSLSALMASPM